MVRTTRHALVALGLTLAGPAGCYEGPGARQWAPHGGGIDLDGEDDGGDGGADDDQVDAQGDAGARAQLRRLTGSQLANALAAIFGDGLVLPEALEPDLVLDLFSTIGAAQVVTSELGVEQYDAAFEDVVDQVFDDPARQAALVPCDPAEKACRSQVLGDLALAAWRRPVSDDELAPYVALADENATRFADPLRGLEIAVRAVLMSPRTLYLVETGEPDPEREDAWRYTSTEMASRLSFFLWDGPPDDDLLEAGVAGELVDPETIRAQARRMLEDPRARRGVMRFFDEYLGLGALAGVSKDPELYPAATPELFAAMREEVLRMIEHVVFDEGGTWGDVLATTTTFVDPPLATIYGVAYPAGGDGFAQVQMPEGRMGLLGTAAFLSAQSHRTLTSPTARGRWIQIRLRCLELPPPPPDVDTTIPEAPDGQPITMRDRLQQHRTDPTCAGCHDVIDPLGLSLEHFDAIGAFRATDAGLSIDASGVLDGQAFDGLPGLAAALADDPAVGACLSRQMLRYAIGHVEVGSEDPWVDELVEDFEAAEGRVLDFLPELVASPAFRRLAAQG